jgi:hypothetical protein
MANTTLDTYPEDYSGSLNALELIGALAIVIALVLIWVHYVDPYLEKRRIERMNKSAIEYHKNHR